MNEKEVFRIGTREQSNLAVERPHPNMSIALGIVSDEPRFDRRFALREMYADAARWNVRVRFILDVARAHLAVDANASDVRLVRVVGRWSHCIHKTYGWWQRTLEEDEDAEYLVKTDDDAYVRLDRLSSVFRGKPFARHVYGGILGYTSFRPTEWQGTCYGYGLKRAIKLKRTLCHKDEGPVPFAIGPLIVTSRALAAWLAGRMTLDPKQTCKNEDRMIGYAVSRRSGVSLLSFGAYGMANGDGATFVTHHVRDARFASRTFANWTRFRPKCMGWSQQSTLVASMPCCHDWNICTLVR